MCFHWLAQTHHKSWHAKQLPAAATLTTRHLCRSDEEESYGGKQTQSGLVGRDTSLPSPLPYRSPGAVQSGGESRIWHRAEEMCICVPVHTCGSDAEGEADAETEAATADSLGSAADLRGDGRVPGGTTQQIRPLVPVDGNVPEWRDASDGTGLAHGGGDATKALGQVAVGHGAKEVGVAGPIDGGARAEGGNAVCLAGSADRC
jgi:hypothetical protein